MNKLKNNFIYFQILFFAIFICIYLSKPSISQTQTPPPPTPTPTPTLTPPPPATPSPTPSPTPTPPPTPTPTLTPPPTPTPTPTPTSTATPPPPSPTPAPTATPPPPTPTPTPCAIDDVKCHCENGDIISQSLAAEKYINKCCPFLFTYIPGTGPDGTTLGVTPVTPDVEFLNDIPRCGQCVGCSGSSAMCEKIILNVCGQDIGGQDLGCPNICAAVHHEVLHYVDCLLRQQPLNICDVLKIHISIQDLVATTCQTLQQNDPLASCIFTCAEFERGITVYCNDYCKNIQSTGETCNQICVQQPDTCRLPDVNTADLCKSYGIPCPFYPVNCSYDPIAETCSRNPTCPPGYSCKYSDIMTCTCERSDDLFSQ